MARLDFDWGYELWGKDPELFNLSSYISNKRSNYRTAASGQIWFILPPDSAVNLYSSDKKIYCPGIITNGKWKPLERSVNLPHGLLGPEILKLIYHKFPHPEIDKEHSRPGILLCASNSITTPEIIAFKGSNRAIWIPGQSNSCHRHGELGLVWPKGSFIQKHSTYFYFWGAWGLSTAKGSDLLCPYNVSINKCSHISLSSSTRSVLQYCRCLFSELLGIHPWSGSPIHPPNSLKPRRGEIVLVRLGSSNDLTPCLVVSPNDFNDSSNALVVIRCILYKPNDDYEDLVVPLSSSSINFTKSRLSVALPLVRGFFHASDYYKLLSPRFFLDKIDVKTWETIDRKMRNLYDYT